MNSAKQPACNKNIHVLYTLWLLTKASKLLTTKYSNNTFSIYCTCNNFITLTTAAKRIHSQPHWPKLKVQLYKYLFFFSTELHRHFRHCMLCRGRSLLHDVLGKADPSLHLWGGWHCSQKRTRHLQVWDEFASE